MTRNDLFNLAGAHRGGCLHPTARLVCDDCFGAALVQAFAAGQLSMRERAAAVFGYSPDTWTGDEAGDAVSALPVLPAPTEGGADGK